VTTAVTLNFNQQAALIAALERFLQARLKLEYRVDPDILGGVVFKAGDTQIDTCVRSRLNDMRRQLEAARVN
jgi:F-type H+-transporting ATPase subunit delta